MGSSIGPVFTAALLASNAGTFDIVLNSNSPAAILIIFTLGVSFYFGFGAAITGFAFLVMDE